MTAEQRAKLREALTSGSSKAIDAAMKELCKPVTVQTPAPGKHVPAEVVK